MDLSVYLNEFNSIKKDIRLDNDSYLDVQLKYLSNYLDQMMCVKSLELFDTDSDSSIDGDETLEELQDNQDKLNSSGIYLANKSNIFIEKRELKLKLMYKLNALLNEKFEEIERIL